MFERNGNNCLAASPLLLLALRALPESGALQSASAGFWSALALTLCVTNQIHAWRFAARAPRVALYPFRRS